MKAEEERKGEKELKHAIAQDYETGEVLMLAHMDEEALRLSIETGKAHYWSRSRGKLWRKGEISGNEQIIKDILIDCDEDTVLLKVKQIGGACHTGYRSCFYRRMNEEIVGKKVFEPAEKYGKKGDK
ncbi:MAG: phosphoribosyl-AMP cyclohydrolase [Candidatus Syntrophoarchaeum sp.]|nr:phosphoribosyl-AMP cyclohydrolase [Methanomicrobia archaeon]MBL7117877.1 phosphoribosyl-AMP cyclohydrolase [Candidatus Syntrophoarchaeum sp.]